MKQINWFADEHVWLHLETSELEIKHINDCPVQSILLGTEAYVFSDYEYLGAL